MILIAIGLLMALIGFLMLKFVPWLGTYQPDGFARSAILIGLILLLGGIGLIIFGWFYG